MGSGLEIIDCVRDKVCRRSVTWPRYHDCRDFPDTSPWVTCASNNGNVTRQQIGFGAIASAPAFAETQVYQYNDPANRLTQASGAPTPTASANWVEPNGFDAVGNRWVVASG